MPSDIEDFGIDGDLRFEEHMYSLYIKACRQFYTL